MVFPTNESVVCVMDIAVRWEHLYYKSRNLSPDLNSGGVLYKQAFCLLVLAGLAMRYLGNSRFFAVFCYFLGVFCLYFTHFCQSFDCLNDLSFNLHCIQWFFYDFSLVILF